MSAIPAKDKKKDASITKFFEKLASTQQDSTSLNANKF